MKNKKILTLVLIIIISFQAIFHSVVYAVYTYEEVGVEENDEYAEYCAIKSGKAKLYKNTNSNKKDITVTVNAGHGTSGGSNKQVQSHPDGSGKVTGGSTPIGATMATAVSTGMDFNNGVEEATATKEVAIRLRDLLLDNGYNVLMIRDSDDVQLDNIARTILANKYADLQVSLHFDDSPGISGAYYTMIPTNENYRNMEPVNSNYERCNELGKALIEGLKQRGDIAINNEEAIEMDLVQISYARVPSMVVEMANGAFDTTDENYQKLAEGVYKGIAIFLNQNPDLINTKKKSKKGILDSLFSSIMQLAGDVIDFFKFLLGDVPQMLVHLIVTIPDGTWKDFKITYKYDDLKAEGNKGVRNKYTNVSEDKKESTYYTTIDGKTEELSKDTEIPVIRVDLYHFASGTLKLLDMDFFTYKEGILAFISAILHITIYLCSAFLIVSLIWNAINIVRASITPKEKVKHKDNLNIFIKSVFMLVGTILVMALCIYLSKVFFLNMKLNDIDELPIRVNVESDKNVSFSTSVIGYLRYKSDLGNTDMIEQKFSYSAFYVILALGNCVLLVFMIIRYLMLVYLSLIGPIVACQEAIREGGFIKMTYRDWVIRYITWALMILIIAIPYKIVLEMYFKEGV